MRSGIAAVAVPARRQQRFRCDPATRLRHTVSGKRAGRSRDFGRAGGIASPSIDGELNPCAPGSPRIRATSARRVPSHWRHRVAESIRVEDHRSWKPSHGEGGPRVRFADGRIKIHDHHRVLGPVGDRRGGGPRGSRRGVRRGEQVDGLGLTQMVSTHDPCGCRSPSRCHCQHWHYLM